MTEHAKDAAPSAGGLPIWDAVRLHVSRAWSCDFTRMEATDSERRAIVASPRKTNARPLQDYLAWRRSMAWVAIVPAIAATVLGFIAWAGSVDGETGAIAFVTLLWAGSKAALVVALALVIREWPRPRRTRRYLRVGWGLALIVPVLILILPLSSLAGATAPAMPARLDTEEDLRALLDALGFDIGRLLFGIMAFWQAVPSLLAMFPGLARAGLTLKTLLPGRSIGPVVTAATGPIYTVFCLAVFTQIQQIGNSWILGFGILAVAAAPLAISLRARELFSPMTREEVATRVARVRSQGRILQAVGLLLIAIALFTAKIFNKSLVGFSSESAWFTVGKLVEIAVWFVAMLTSYTVVSTDGLIQAAAAADRALDRDAESPQREKDEESLDALEALFRAPPEERVA